MRLSKVPGERLRGGGVELLRLHQMLHQLLDAQRIQKPASDEVAAARKFEDAVRASVARSLQETAASILKHAGGLMALKSRVPLGGHIFSDLDRANQRVDWVLRHADAAVDFVFWVPAGWMAEKQISKLASGIALRMPPQAQVGGRPLPLLLRADFPRGCVLVPLEKQDVVAVEFCAWPAGNRPSVGALPTEVLKHRVDSVSLPLGWQGEATARLKRHLL